jgi:uncharacterized protein (DUF983 family)
MAYVNTSTWNEKKKREIVEALEKRGVRGACPMCSKGAFTLLDGFFNHPVQAELSATVAFGGPTIPTIAIACTNCGFISQHAAGVLGLLSDSKAGK